MQAYMHIRDTRASIIMNDGVATSVVSCPLCSELNSDIQERWPARCNLDASDRI